jgi:2-polyprenyl-3-methyl-5-hydroxy-6-metoxy-1,4-benzoquinol methylase
MSTNIRKKVNDFLVNTSGLVQLGESSSYNWVTDPSRLFFSLSRYKFVSRLFSDFSSVLEIGCADGFGSYLVSKKVCKLTCVDIDRSLISSALKSTARYADNIEFLAGDILNKNFLPRKKFDGIFMLDVLEHIDCDTELKFLSAIIRRLKPTGCLIIGLPSLESQQYASELSRIGHINCKTQPQLKELCLRFFHICHLFGANDEIVNLGFPALQHYRLALCSGLRTLRD